MVGQPRLLNLINKQFNLHPPPLRPYGSTAVCTVYSTARTSMFLPPSIRSVSTTSPNMVCSSAKTSYNISSIEFPFIKESLSWRSPSSNLKHVYYKGREKGDFQKKRCRKKHIAIHTQIVSVCAEVGLEVKLFTSNKPHIQFE